MASLWKVPTEEIIRVLIAEDEESFIDALAVGLERENFVVTIARDGAAAVELFNVEEFDLVLLDVMLPKLSGLDVCRIIRSKSAVPIIMVTAKSTEIDTVVGLEIGADDYVAKPYRLRELISRIRAVLRRAALNNADQAKTDADIDESDSFEGTDSVTVGEVRIDPERHECIVRGEEVKLPLKEFELMQLLLTNAGRVVTREKLIDRVWGYDYVGDTKTLDVHIKRLRSRIELDPANPSLITTIRGLGYRYEAPRSR
jgi:two-component system response regulator RegX3